MNIPIIRLEIESMRHTLQAALMEYTARLDEDLRNAVDAYCTPSNLQRVISDQANRVLDQVISEAVSEWFTKGDGRAAIKEEVSRKLRESVTWTPLDVE